MQKARLGTTGVDFEVGATKRFSPQTTGYLGTLVGLQGVMVKLRVSRRYGGKGGGTGDRKGNNLE
jgi:hypothetical protein